MPPKILETCWIWCTGSQHGGPILSRHFLSWAAWKHSWSPSLRNSYRPGRQSRSLRGLCTVTGRTLSPLLVISPMLSAVYSLFLRSCTALWSWKIVLWKIVILKTNHADLFRELPYMSRKNIVFFIKCMHLISLQLLTLFPYSFVREASW